MVLPPEQSLLAVDATDLHSAIKAAAQRKDGPKGHGEVERTPPRRWRTQKELKHYGVRTKRKRRGDHLLVRIGRWTRKRLFGLLTRKWSRQEAQAGVWMASVDGTECE